MQTLAGRIWRILRAQLIPDNAESYAEKAASLFVHRPMAFQSTPIVAGGVFLLVLFDRRMFPEGAKDWVSCARGVVFIWVLRGTRRPQECRMGGNGNGGSHNSCNGTA